MRAICYSGAVRSRARVLVAVVIALLAHVSVRELVDASRLRVRPIEPIKDRVAIEVTRAGVERAPAAPERPPLALDDAPRRVVERKAAPIVDAAESAPIVDSTPVPVVESAPVAPMLPRAAPPPSSFLERVIAGASGVPALDPVAMLRSPPETDAQAAERKIQAFTRAAATRGAPPGPDAGTSLDLLEKLDDGTYRYETGGFIASIQVDGAVVFINKDNNAGLGTSGLGRDLLAPYGPAIDPIARIDGAPAQREMGIPMGMPSSTLGSGSFDPTAAMLRAQGQDPYEHEKLCFLDETQELRAGLRVAHEKAQMAGLRRSLERAWFDETHTPAERRAALFAIWDECREEEVGMLARELVESFVRQHLPKGSPDAFTDDELAALNATRTSTMEFAPYG